MKYSVEAWETEDDREIGNGLILESELSLDEALDLASRTFWNGSASATEVLDENGNAIMTCADGCCTRWDEGEYNAHGEKIFEGGI